MTCSVDLQSYISAFPTAVATSLFCKVLRLLSSVCTQARMVSSKMKISQAFEKMMGASALIIYVVVQMMRSAKKSFTY
jgi:hypothetical protein